MSDDIGLPQGTNMQPVQAPDMRPQPVSAVDAVTGQTRVETKPDYENNPEAGFYDRAMAIADGVHAGLHKVPLDGVNYDASVMAREYFSPLIRYRQNTRVDALRYQSELNAAAAAEDRLKNVDPVALEILASYNITNNPAQYRNELLELGKYGQESLITDEKVRAQLKKKVLMEHYERELQGKPMPQGILSSDLMMSLSPQELGSVTRLMAVNDFNVISRTPEYQEKTFWEKGWDSQGRKGELHSAFRDKNINDAQYLYESNLNALTNDGENSDIIFGIGSGLKDFGAGMSSWARDLVEGAGRKNLMQDNALNFIADAEERVAKRAENTAPGLFNQLGKVLSDTADNMLAQQATANMANAALGSFIHNAAYAEAEANHTENVVRILAQNPDIDAGAVFKQTQDNLHTRAAMNMAVSFASFIPVGAPLTAGIKAVAVGGGKVIGKGAAAAARLAHIPNIKIIPGALSAPKAGVNGIMHNAIRNAVLNRARVQAAALVGANAGLRTGKEIGVAAADNALQNTLVEAATAYEYKGDANELTNKTGGQWDAAADAAAETFVQNLMAGIVMGLPNAFYAIGSGSREISLHMAEQEKIQLQQRSIEKAMAEGLDQEIIRQKIQLQNIYAPREALHDALKNNPQALEELKSIANSGGEHAAFAEDILLSMWDNPYIAKNLDSDLSHEFYIFDPVRMAYFTQKGSQLKKLLDENIKADITSRTPAEILEELEGRIASKVSELADSEMMFEKNFVAETLNEIQGMEKTSAIAADINNALRIPEGVAANMHSGREFKQVARRYSMWLANAITTFAKESNRDPVEFYRSLNLKFKAGQRVYDISTGKTIDHAEFEHKGNERVIYISDKFVASTLFHELSHLYLDMLATSGEIKHIERLDNLAKRWGKKNNVTVDSWDTLTPDQVEKIQEAVAYSSTFALASRHLRNLDLVADEIKSDAGLQELLDKGELAKLKKEIKERAPWLSTDKADRYDSEGYLSVTSELESMLARDLLRHMSSTDFDAFRADFETAFKEKYGYDYLPLETQFIRGLNILADGEQLAKTSRGFTDTVLNPDAQDMDIIRLNLGDEFADTLQQHYQNAYDEINSIDLTPMARTAVKLGRDNARLQEIKKSSAERHLGIQAAQEKLNAKDVEIGRQRAAVDAAEKTEQRIRSEYSHKRGKDRAPGEKRMAAQHEIVMAEKAKLNALINERRDISNEIKELSKKVRSFTNELEKTARNIDAVVSMEIDRTSKTVAAIRQGDEDARANADPLSLDIIKSLEIFDSAKDLGVKFTADYLKESGFDENRIKDFSEAGFVTDKAGEAVTLNDFRDIVYGDMDISADVLAARLNDGIKIDSDVGEFIARKVEDAHIKDRELKDYLEKHEAAIARHTMATLSDLSYEVYKKTNPQLNRDAFNKEIELETARIALKVSTAVKPYHFERKAQSYYRQGIKALKNNKFKAAKLFAHAAALQGAAKELRNIKRRIDTRKATLKRLLNRNSSSETIKNEYSIDTFMAAKRMAYDIGFVESDSAFKDIANYNGVKTDLQLDNSADADLLQSLGIDPAILRDRAVPDYANMTYGEVLRNISTIDSLLAISRSARSYAKQFKKVTGADIGQALIDAVEAKIGPAPEKTVDTSDPGGHKGPRNKTMSVLQNIRIDTMRPETIFAMLDGKTNGKLYNYFFEPIMDAEQEAMSYSRQVNMSDRLPLVKALKELELKGPKLDAPYVIEGTRMVRSGNTVKEETIKHQLGGVESVYTQAAMLIANMGTVSNRKAICRSMGITEEKLVEVIKDLTDKGIITTEMWRLVEKHIWGLYDSIYDKTARAFREVNGYFFLKEKGIDIRLEDGTIIKGGYCPLNVVRAREEIDLADPFNVDSYTLNTIPGSDGFAKERVVHSHEISLSLGDMFYAMERQINYAYMAQPVRRSAELMNADNVKSSLERFMPGSVEVITNAMNSAANMGVRRAETKLQIMFDAARRANLSMLAYNLTNTAIGFSQLAVTAGHIGVKATARGLISFVTGGRSTGITRTDIDAVSSVMRNRNFFNGEEFHNTIKRTEVKGKTRSLMDLFVQYAYVMQSYVQNILDYITWVGAYDKALNEKALNNKLTGRTQEGFSLDAIKAADTAVRQAQTSRSRVNVSLNESSDSNWTSFLTPFSGVFISMLNTQRIRFAEIDARHSNAWAAYCMKAYAIAYIWIAPAMLTEYIRGAMVGDEESTPEALISSAGTAGYMVHPVIGVLVNFLSKQIARSYFDADIYADNGIFSVPLESVLVNTWQGINMAASENEMTVDTYKKLAAPLSLAFLGIHQPLNMFAYMYQYTNDEYFDTGIMDALRGFLTGRASDEQKGK